MFLTESSWGRISLNKTNPSVEGVWVHGGRVFGRAVLGRRSSQPAAGGACPWARGRGQGLTRDPRERRELLGQTSRSAFEQ